MMYKLKVWICRLLNRPVVGKRTIIYHRRLSNLMFSFIGDDCKIHSHVTIGKGVNIGNKCKVQAGSLIYAGVTLGDNVFIGPGVCFTNDKRPPSGTWKETKVGDGVSIGANATILPGLTLGTGCRIGAGAVVTKSFLEGNQLIGGNPAGVIKKLDFYNENLDQLV